MRREGFSPLIALSSFLLRVIGRLSSQDRDRVVDDRIERLQCVTHAAGGAGEVDDERASARAGETARERGAWEALEGADAQQLGDAGGLALEDGARRFGSDVARGQAGTAGGEHEVGAIAVAPVEELAHDLDVLVGDERARRDLVAAQLRPADDGVTGRVGALAAMGGVRDRQDSDSHGAGLYGVTRASGASVGICRAMRVTRKGE